MGTRELDAVVRPDETRKSREGMREYDIRSELMDMSQSILQDRGVPHTCITESFEDRSSVLFEETRVFQACIVDSR